MQSDELTDDQKILLHHLIAEHDKHPELSIFGIYGQMWTAARLQDDSFAPAAIIDAYCRLTIKQRNAVGSYVALPF